jgi:hypothetical protein
MQEYVAKYKQSNKFDCIAVTLTHSNATSEQCRSIPVIVHDISTPKCHNCTSAAVRQASASDATWGPAMSTAIELQQRSNQCPGTCNSRGAHLSQLINELLVQHRILRRLSLTKSSNSEGVYSTRKHSWETMSLQSLGNSNTSKPLPGVVVSCLRAAARGLKRRTCSLLRSLSSAQVAHRADGRCRTAPANRRADLIIASARSEIRSSVATSKTVLLLLSAGCHTQARQPLLPFLVIRSAAVVCSHSRCIEHMKCYASASRRP